VRSRAQRADPAWNWQAMRENNVLARPPLHSEIIPAAPLFSRDQTRILLGKLFDHHAEILPKPQHPRRGNE